MFARRWGWRVNIQGLRPFFFFLGKKNNKHFFTAAVQTSGASAGASPRTSSGLVFWGEAIAGGRGFGEREREEREKVKEKRKMTEKKEKGR